MDTSGLIAEIKSLYRRLTSPEQDSNLPAPIRAAWRWVRVLYRQLDRDRAFERAGTLAYVSLIGLVPMLMLVFGVLGVFGLTGDALESIIFGTFLGDIPQVRSLLLPGLEQVNLGALSAIGMVGWLWVSFRIYMTMEVTYSEMFRVQVTRSLGRRLMNFYLALTAVPVLFGLALFGSMEVARRIGVPWWGDLLTTALPFLLLTGAIRLLPATYVKWGPAIAGGLVSSALIQIGVWAFSLYLQTFASRDPILVIYGTVGVIPVFLFWLWLVWVFVLLGVEVAHVGQEYKSLVRAEREQQREEAQKLRIPSLENALELGAAVAWYFEHGRAPVDALELAERVRLPQGRVDEVLEVLQASGIVLRSDRGWTVAKPPQYVPIATIVDEWRARTSLRQATKFAPVATELSGALSRCFEGTLADAAARWVEPERPDPGV